MNPPSSSGGQGPAQGHPQGRREVVQFLKLADVGRYADSKTARVHVYGVR
jgi:hypothetical protein